jgi:hypothetical protein
MTAVAGNVGRIIHAICETFDKATLRQSRLDPATLGKDVGFREGTGYRLAANFGFATEFEDYMAQYLIEPGRNTLVGRTALEGRTVHIADVRTNPEYTCHSRTCGTLRSGLYCAKISEARSSETGA